MIKLERTYTLSGLTKEELQVMVIGLELIKHDVSLLPAKDRLIVACSTVV